MGFARYMVGSGFHMAKSKRRRGRSGHDPGGWYGDISATGTTGIDEKA